MRFLGYLIAGAVGATLATLALNGADWSGLLGGQPVTWLTIRTSGIVAYLLLSASTVLGLLTSSRILTRWLQPPVTLELHRVFSFLSLAALGVHGGALLLDQVEPFTIPQVMAPFMSSYRPGAVAMGILSGYLSAALTFSFYARAKIKPRIWRALHFSAFAAFALATVHGIMAGSDSGVAWVQLMYLASGALVLFLTLMRILGGRHVRSRRSSSKTRIRSESDIQLSPKTAI